jgi:hypothetical protein
MTEGVNAMSNNRKSLLIRGTLTLALLALSLAAASPKSIGARARQPEVTAAGAYEEIRCPVGRIRAEITTPIPSPWWQTPQEGGLVLTRVEMIAGKKTLVCLYRAYGTTVGVMREPPAGTTDCRATKGGFVCR